jgi:transcriptional regulator with XRE-family HTH domain
MRNIESKNIPNCLKRYRKARGLQQKQVAKILGFKCASMISRWEKGSCLPNTINLFKLSILYRTLSDSLFIDLVRDIKSDIYQREERILSKR